MSNNIFVRCMAISMSYFLNTPYKEQTITEMYAPMVFQSENTINNKKLSRLLGGVKGGE